MRLADVMVGVHPKKKTTATMDFLWTLLLAALMGLVEGLTEFLPVSSTGHMILLGAITCFEDKNNVFKVMIQFGAILAICVLYFRDLLELALKAPTNPEARTFVLGIVVAFLPAGFIGFLLGDYIKAYLFNPLVVSIALITGGFIILFVERLVNDPRVTSLHPTVFRREQFTIPLFFKIGLLQCMALIPGVSRSGATIIGSMLLRVHRTQATEFSFFLAIPTMMGAFVLDGYRNYKHFDASQATTILVGFAVAFLAAMLVVRWAIGFISRNGFWPFAWYRIAVGSLMLGIILFTQDITLTKQCTASAANAPQAAAPVEAASQPSAAEGR
jgi:undecaprenyl-diphosphatase